MIRRTLYSRDLGRQKRTTANEARVIPLNKLSKHKLLKSPQILVNYLIDTLTKEVESYKKLRYQGKMYKNDKRPGTKA